MKQRYHSIVGMLTVLLLLSITHMATAQSTLWERNSRTDAAAVKPDWFGAGTERGIAFGMNGTTPVVYVASRNGGNSIKMVNADTGADITDGPVFDLASVTGGFHTIQDINVTSDGKVVLTNMTLDARTEAAAFKVYVFEPTGGAPISTFAYIAEGAAAIRLGDKATVKGSWADGTIEVWTSANINPGLVLKLTSTNQGTNWVPSVTTLSATAAGDQTIPANSAVTPVSNGFMVNGNGGLARRYNDTGVFQVGQTAGYTSSNTGVKSFTSGGRELIAMYTYRPGTTSAGDILGYVAVWDITNPALPLFVGRTPAMSSATVANSVNGDLDVRVNSDGSYILYGLATDQGLIAYGMPAYVAPSFLTYWDTNGLSGTVESPLQPTSIATNLTTGGLVRGSGLTATSLANGFASSNWVSVSPSTAASAGHFYEFSLKANPGFMFSVDGLGFLFRRSGTGPNKLQLSYSLNNSEFVALGDSITYTTTEDGFPFGPFDLSGNANLKKLDHDDNLVIRLSGWGASAATGTGAIGRQAGPDLQVLGVVETNPDYVAPSNFVANLSGLHENPPVISDGMGTMSAVLTGDQLVVTGQFSGLTGNYTMSHIHTGANGANGGVVFTLSATVGGDSKSGTYTAETNTFTMTEPQIASLAAGTWYVNIHSETSPGGEIRGQIVSDPNTAPVASDITAPASGAELTISGFSGTAFTPTWTASSDVDGDALTYTWQLMTPSNVVILQGKTSNTSITYTYAQVDALLETAGVAVGNSIGLKHRVVVSDGSALTYGEEFAVTLVRGTLSSVVTIAEAYALPVNTAGVTIEAVVTRVRGREARIQDETGGFSVFLGSSGTYFDMVADGSVRSGDSIQITGRRAAFNGLNQLDQISELVVMNRDNALPAAKLVTLAELRDNGSTYESQLVRVEGLTVNPAGDELWSGGTSGRTYRITDATVTEEAVVDFRVPNPINTNLVGDPIPTGEFVFQGVLGRFNAVFQLYAVEKSDVEFTPPPMAGDFTIPRVGDGPGFPTLSAAVTALNLRGASAQVNFLITADLVDTNAVIRIDRSDLTEETPLVIMPASATPVKVDIRQLHVFATSHVFILGNDSFSMDDEMFKAGKMRKAVNESTTMDNLNTAIFDELGEMGPRNLTFNLATAAAPNAVIYLQGKVEDSYVMSVNVTMSASQGIAIPAFLLNRVDAAGPGQGGLTNVVIGNVQIGSADAITKFKDGFQIFGSASGAFANEGVMLLFNDLHVGHRGLSTQMIRDNAYFGNRVWIYGRSTEAVHIGMNINTPVGQILVANNRFLRFQTNRSAATTMIGINLTNSLNDNGVFVYNNYLAMNHSKAEGVTGVLDNVIGIAHSGAGSIADFYVFHNTINIPANSQTGRHAALAINGGSVNTPFSVFNNLFINRQTDGFAIDWNGMNLNADFNNLSGTVLLRNGADSYTTLSALKATGNYQNTVSHEVNFVSNTNLDLTGSSLGDEMLIGDALGTSFEDINGRFRSPLAPYMGAFEGPAFTVIAATFDLISPDSGTNLTLSNDPDQDVVITWEESYSTVAFGHENFNMLDDGFAHGGDGSNAVGKYIGSSLGMEATLTTPVMQNVGELSFWMSTFSNATVLTVVVEGTNDAETWSELATYNAVAGGTGDINVIWKLKTILLDEPAAMVRFRVIGTDGAPVAGAVYFDDFSATTYDGSEGFAFNQSFETWTEFVTLTYTWHLETANGNFSNPKLSILSDNNGQSPSLTLSHPEVEQAMADIGVFAGLAFNGKWTVTASVGSATVFANSTNALTIQRYVDVSVDEREAPLVFALGQNYPNPFNPNTAIEYSIAETANVTLTVFTITGQVVTTLVNEVKSPGVYNVSFDASRLSSGVYIYRIVAGGFTDTQKMTLIK